MESKNFNYWSYKLLIFFIAWSMIVFLALDNVSELFKTNWSYILVGFLGAILGNLTAIGGGIVFIPTMMFVYKLAPVMALKVALASQLFGMSSGAVGWIQRKVVPIYALKYCVPPLLLGSFVSTFIFHPSALLVKVLFGPVSIILGLLTLLLATYNNKSSENKQIPQKAIIPMMLMSFLGGIITGWIAIGEGELVAALLMLGFGVAAEVAIGLGVVLLAINSIFLVIIHQFFLDGIPWHIGLFTGLGCVFGARLAAFMSSRFSSKILKIIFAIIAIGDGILFIFQYAFH